MPRSMNAGGVALMLLLGGAATPARTQEVPDAAASICRRGMETYRQGTRQGLEEAIQLWLRCAALLRDVGDKSGEGTTINNIGAVHNSLGRRDSALVYYSRALAISREVGDRSGEGTTLNNIGYVHRLLGQPDSALLYYSRALAIRREVGDRSGQGTTLNNIGALHWVLGRLDSALVYYSRALAIAREVDDRSGEGTTLHNIGAVHSSLGQPDSALVYYPQALAIRREVGDRSGEGTTLNSIGYAHHWVGRPDSALVYYSRALAIRRDVGDRAGEGGTLNDIGGVHRSLGRPDSALLYFSRALAIRRQVSDRSGEGMTLHNIGAVHHSLGRPDSALVYFSQALAIRRDVADRLGEGTTLNSIGLVHWALGRPDSAVINYSRALAIAREVGDHSGEGMTLHNMGAVHWALGQADSAVVYYSRALPILREVGDRYGEGTTLSNIGYVHQYGLSPPRPERAVAYYDSAAAVLALIAGHAGGDQNRLSYSEQGVLLFQHWPRAWLALAPQVGESRGVLAALAAAERGRAQALLDLMRKSAGEAGLAVPTPGADLVAEGRSLATAATRSGAAALSYLITPDTLLVWLARPAGAVEVYRTAVSERELARQVAVLRRGLGADSAAVRARLALRNTPDLEESTRGFGFETDSLFGSAEAAARQLSEWLLPATLRDQLADSGELVIVPSGALNLLPFAVLPVGNTNEPLGLRYALRYSPSLAALAETGRTAEARTGARARMAALVVGNPAMPPVQTFTGEEIALGPLAGAEKEGRWVAGQVGTDLLRGSVATEARVKQLLPGAALVHLATHGYAYSSEARARDSFIALAPSEGEDGLLTVGEVLDEVPDLSADLVVLSACQTGLGDLKQAEGTVGLQRAFLARGARSVLVSLWSVSDDATERLMQSFYTHWLSGASKSEALRRAQEEVRSTPGFEHPEYWAAFQLVGAR